MKNKKVYLVIHSTGQYEDRRENINETCFSTLSAAEKCKEGIENYYKTDTPFPLDWCTKEEFDQMVDDEVEISEKDSKTYNEWAMEKYIKYDFGSCWIKELKLE